MRKTGVPMGTLAPAFKTTGDVIAKFIGVCKETVEADGVSQSLQAFGTAVDVIPILLGNELAVNEIWVDASPTTTVEPTPSDVANGFIIPGNTPNGLTIGMRVTPDTALAGIVDFYCTWKPLSVDGNVVAA